jgi:hypothetical protein
MGSIAYRRNKNGTCSYRAQSQKAAGRSKTFSTKEEAIAWIQALGDTFAPKAMVMNAPEFEGSKIEMYFIEIIGLLKQIVEKLGDE